MPTTKYNLPNIYIGEYKQLQALFLLGDDRSTIPAGTFTSSTSGLSYAHTGGNDLFSQLTTFLTPYLFTASDYNNIESEISTLDDTVTTVENKIGRYNSEFGFDGAVYSNTAISNGTVSIVDLSTTATQNTGSAAVNIYTAHGAGQRLDATFTATMDVITKVSPGIYGKAGTPVSATVTIYDETSAQTLGSKTLLDANITTGNFVDFVFDTPIQVTRGHVLQIRVDCAGANSSNYYQLYYVQSDVQVNAYYINTTGSWGTIISNTGYDFRYQMTYQTKYTSGTVTKTVTLQDLKTWGNLKFSKTTPTNTSVTCAVKDISDNVLIANATSIADLSAINVATYTALKFVWTLSRNSANDTSPSITSPSVTWEGDEIIKQLAQASGDMFYASGANTITRLPKDTDGTFLTLVNGLPSWQTLVPNAQSATGTYTGNGTNSRQITVGFQPKFIFVMEQVTTDNYLIGMFDGTNDNWFQRRSGTDYQNSTNSLASINSTGFVTGAGANLLNSSGASYAWVAIG